MDLPGKRKESSAVPTDGVYGIGETTVGYWQYKRAADVQILCSGGNVDWAMQSEEATLVQSKLIF